jgi:hypothetical protein
MRRCYKIDYPRRTDRDDTGRRVRVVSLPPVKCGAVAALSNVVVWGDGTRQRTYTCDAHTEDLRKITENAGFPWEPRPYPSRTKTKES